MRAVVQRALSAQMHIEGELYSQISQGLVVLIGIERDDTSEDIKWLADKIIKMRLFDDVMGVMNLDVAQVSGEVMLVSQFTLHASTRKGNRPSYIRAAPEEISRPLYNAFVEYFRAHFMGVVATGRFAADMKLSLTNDGPVTIIIDTKSRE